MTARELAGKPRVVAGALLALLLVQVVAVASLRDEEGATPAAAACGSPVPPVDTSVPLDAQLQLKAELTPGTSSSGTAIVVNRGAKTIAVLTTQAVLLAPGGAEPVVAPERPRSASGLLGPGQFLRQPVAITSRSCPGGDVRPGFYELAVVAVVQRVGGGGPVATVTSRRAVVVRPGRS